MLNDAFERIRRIQIQTTREVEDLFAGAYRSAFKGQGLEFEDVREYEPGDDVRRIDWNLTARMNHPFVKNFREERELTVMIIVDVSASSRFGSGSHLKSEIIAEIGAVLAFSAIRNQDRVGLLLFSDQVELYLSPKKGLRHVLRTIRELLFFKPKHKGTDIEKALSFLGHVQRKHTICFVISDFLMNLEPLKHEFSILNQRHELIFIQVIDDHEIHFSDLGLAYLRDLETGEMRLVNTSDITFQKQFTDEAEGKREKLDQMAKQIKAGFISISCQDSYIHPLRKFFKLRSRKR